MSGPSYLPKWLPLDEFLDNLPGNDVPKNKETVLRFMRDRLIDDGALDHHFRFLDRKPPMDNTGWLTRLSAQDVMWGDSCFRVHTETGDEWFDVEIAADALRLFEPPWEPDARDYTEAGLGKLSDDPFCVDDLSAPVNQESRAQEKRPKQNRSKWAQEKVDIKNVFPQGVPPRSELSNQEVCRLVAEHSKRLGRPVPTNDTILRAAGRRKVEQ